MLVRLCECACVISLRARAEALTHARTRVRSICVCVVTEESWRGQGLEWKMRLYFVTAPEWRSTFQPALVGEGIFSSRKIANAETCGTRHRLEITATVIGHVVSENIARLFHDLRGDVYETRYFF